MIHIVFQEKDVQVLAKSFDLDESLRGKIVLIKDDYSVGPILNLYTAEGIAERRQWWKEVIGADHQEQSDNEQDIDDNKTVLELTNTLDNDNDEIIWIWAAQNKHDVSGYYWLMSQLKNYQGRIFILYLNNLPFINEKGHIFYPTNIFEIQPKEFLKAKKLARPITLSEFEVDPDEWTRLSNESKGVRILEGGKKLVQHNYDYFDDDLIKCVTPDWQKASKLFHSFFNKAKVTTGDAYLLWRLKLMALDGKIDSQGDGRNMKDLEVKSKVVAR